MTTTSRSSGGSPFYRLGRGHGVQAAVIVGYRGMERVHPECATAGFNTFAQALFARLIATRLIVALRNHAIQPADWIIRRDGLPRQEQKALLHDILWGGGPLPGIEYTVAAACSLKSLAIRFPG